MPLKLSNYEKERWENRHDCTTGTCSPGCNSLFLRNQGNGDNFNHPCDNPCGDCINKDMSYLVYFQGGHTGKGEKRIVLPRRVMLYK